MSDFEVGQRVWTVAYGWGSVVYGDEEPSIDFPICVEFEDSKRQEWYTTDGKYYEDENRTLFFQSLAIPNEALIAPKMEVVLNQGDIVLFQNGDLGYVEKYSGNKTNVFQYHSRVPRSLDEAFDTKTGYKNLIKKVVGNINAG